MTGAAAEAADDADAREILLNYPVEAVHPRLDFGEKRPSDFVSRDGDPYYNRNHTEKDDAEPDVYRERHDASADACHRVSYHHPKADDDEPLDVGDVHREASD